MAPARKILANSIAAGLGFPSKSTMAVLDVQGNESCPIQIIMPPHAGKRDLITFAARVSAAACRAWLQVTNSSRSRGSRPFSSTNFGQSIHQG